MSTIRTVCPHCGEKIEVTVDVALAPVITAAPPADGKTDMSFCDPQPVIDFPGWKFCFTGKFAQAGRDDLERMTTLLGGHCAHGVTMDLDYLVVGSVASKGWAYGSYGDKIDKALQYRQNGSHVKIVSEADFLAAFRRENDRLTGAAEAPAEK